MTTCANDYAREQKRQTITASDVLAAINELDFDEFTPQLEAFLAQYRADEQSKKDAKAKSKAALNTAQEESKASTATPMHDDEGEDDEDDKEVETRESGTNQDNESKNGSDEITFNNTNEASSTLIDDAMEEG